MNEQKYIEQLKSDIYKFVMQLHRAGMGGSFEKPFTDFIVAKLLEREEKLWKEMEEKRVSEVVINSYDETNSRDDAQYKGQLIGRNDGIDMCQRLLIKSDEI